ncbi:hypothetical protein [Microbacterium sp. VKM Ac-2923]|uniref:hypothetical protein n=1 Tax=Microbacterium sp. VKM Ac-2923 TaxID=2929476 RepID=UPI001FB2A9B5|nr:hypothetical protein [Microbacterium sp. VKM Ac-2923]MCJ1708713.1 hypothetical protein [Microbacterium sp. VKM Ac-2923]
MDKNTLAGSTNRDSLGEVAGAAQAAAKAQLDAEIAAGLGAQAATNYANTLTAQKDAFIKAATEAGYSEEAVHAYAEEVFKLPDSKTLNLIAETATASTRAENFKNLWESIKNRTVTLTTIGSTLIGGGQAPSVGPVLPGSASGGIIPGPPSERDNRVYKLATGEFVVRAREVAKPENRRILEAMNAGMLKGYATGGYVQPQYASSGSVVRVSTQQVTMPDRFTLMINGQQMDAYVVDRAQGAAADIVRNSSAGNYGGWR